MGGTMAAPVIDSMVASPSVVGPNGSFVVTIVAHDPDETSGVLIGKVRDAAGNETQASALVRISDPLFYELSVPAGFVSVPRAGQPGVFDVTAP